MENIKQENRSGSTDKKGDLFPVISVAVFIILSIGTVAFFYYQNQDLKKMLTEYQTTMATQVPETATGPSEEIIIEMESPQASASASPTATQKACTLEAKICPDGSYVGRTGPNCEFAPCPQDN